MWYQNSRARERKGQFRQNLQLINKKCPYCGAIFKIKLALESHLQTRHSNRPTITVDAIVDIRLGDDDSDVRDTLQMQMMEQSTNQTQQGSPISAMPLPYTEGVRKKNAVDLSSQRNTDEALHSIVEDDVQLSEDNREDDSDECFFESVEDVDDDSLDYYITTSTRNDGTLAHFYSINYNKAQVKSPVNDITNNNNIHNNENNSVMTISNNDNQQELLPNGATDQYKKQQQQQQKKRRYRTQMANQQVRMLRVLFDDVKTPTMADCELVGRRIGLPKRVVQVCVYACV